MKVSIYDIEHTLFEGEAEKVIAKTTTGEITILEGHIPLVTTLVESPVRIFDSSEKESHVTIKSGLLEVRPGNKVVVLVGEMY